MDRGNAGIHGNAGILVSVNEADDGHEGSRRRTRRRVALGAGGVDGAGWNSAGPRWRRNASMTGCSATECRSPRGGTGG